MAEIGFSILVPPARLDAAGTQSFEAEWKEKMAAGHTRLLIDLTNTRYISSGGLRSLLAAVRQAKKHDGTVKLCCPSSHLIEIFEMAGLDQVLEIYPTRALAEFSFK